ncbi:MAG: uracil-DNA glycosylase [Acidobacteria bacterium]|nr:uracil-DNA glycosylase [Acidobacteriota bacterium]
MEILRNDIVSCTRCPRLIAYCREVARVKRKAYLDQEYWGKPVPGFGDPGARVLIIGLAPGAHGANRTGRIFTGDQSGTFLFGALHKTGFASQPESVSRDDGLRLSGAYISAAARCAPPGNKPTPEEIRNCREYLERELGILNEVRVAVALGKTAFDDYVSILRDRAIVPRRSALAFGHGREYAPGSGTPVLLATYHPSQQNTFTGKLTDKMFVAVFRRARKLAGLPPA